MSNLLLEKLHAAGATLTERDGATVVSSFGNSAGEAIAARTKAALFDLSNRRVLALTGEDRVRFLNGMVTKDVKNLAPGQGIYALLCNAKGKILADLYVWGSEDALLVECAPELAARIAETFDHFIIADDVEIEDRSGQKALLHLAGKETATVLSKDGTVLPEKPLQRIAATFSGVKLEIARNDRTGIDGYDLLCATSDAPALWEALLAGGAAPAGEEAFWIVALEQGIPRYGIDFDENNLPQEAGLKHAFSTTKGCYVGQEVICKIESFAHVNRQLQGFEIEGDEPPAGAKLLLAGKEVGHLTRASASPTLGRLLALGYLSRTVTEKSPEALSVEWEGGKATARPHRLPFTV